MKAESVLEGILFALGESADRATLSEAMECTPEEIDRLADSLARELEEGGRGLMLRRLGDSYQLCTVPACYDPLIRICARPKKPELTNVVMETLAIIAYKQPVTKQEIERIRGVSSDHAVNRLIEYGLVCEVGRLNAPGRPILLGTTEEFLKRFRVSSPDDLPTVTPERLAAIEEEAEAEADGRGEEVSVPV
ncbi:MAG: SMC-Scp complex subunit ScpB [Lachnospiraceae bacterium]|nr:SMC-Scp complex subunit ScpB [Lachnospiraceae bacterium]